MIWKDKIKAPYSEVKRVILETMDREHTQEVLGELYIGHHLVEGDIICPFTGKTTNQTFKDPARWGLFNSCEHCNPEGYIAIKTVDKRKEVKQKELDDGKKDE